MTFADIRIGDWILFDSLVALKEVNEITKPKYATLTGSNSITILKQQIEKMFKGYLMLYKPNF